MQVDNNGSVSSFTANGQRVPTPPKKGEVMICQMCGQPMLPKDFSKNERMRKMEFKWHIHERCFQMMDEMADRGVPGLLAERKNADKRFREQGRR